MLTNNNNSAILKRNRGDSMALKQFTDEEARERKKARQREYAKKTGYSAQTTYMKNNTKAYYLRFTKSTDSDIIEKLESVDNRLGYIKSLIRKDIKENPTEK